MPLLSLVCVFSDTSPQSKQLARTQLVPYLRYANPYNIIDTIPGSPDWIKSSYQLDEWVRRVGWVSQFALQSTVPSDAPASGSRSFVSMEFNHVASNLVGTLRPANTLVSCR